MKETNKLKPGERCLLKYLENNTAYHNFRKIAEELDINRKTVQKYLKKLIEKGYIEFDQNNYTNFTIRSIKISRKEEKANEEKC